MHYLIYDSFDQVYPFWEIGGLLYMKMLTYRSEETLTEKNNSTLSSRAPPPDIKQAKTKATSSKRKLLGDFVNCPLSKLALVLKSELW